LTRYKRKYVKVGRFRRGWVTSKRKFQTEGASPTKHCWCQKARVIAISYGIKLSALHCLVLLQSMRETDRHTDRTTTLETALA